MGVSSAPGESQGSRRCQLELRGCESQVSSELQLAGWSKDAVGSGGLGADPSGHSPCRVALDPGAACASFLSVDSSRLEARFNPSSFHNHTDERRLCMLCCTDGTVQNAKAHISRGRCETQLGRYRIRRCLGRDDILEIPISAFSKFHSETPLRGATTIN